MSGEVDQDRIAVAGHSDGGTDVAVLALNPGYADHRIRAYLSLSGKIPLDVPGPWGVHTPGDLLVVVGTNDNYGLQPRATRVYQTAGMVKALLTVEGGDHLNMYIGTSPQAQALRIETVAFLDISLRSTAATATELSTVLQAEAKWKITEIWRHIRGRSGPPWAIRGLSDDPRGRTSVRSTTQRHCASACLEPSIDPSIESTVGIG